jgi:RimJ/RimL family protein N-acetyltransferase
MDIRVQPRRVLDLWPRGMPSLAMKVSTTFYRRMILMVRPLDDTIPSPWPRLPVVFKILTKEDLPAYHRFRPDRRTSLIQNSLARGEQCFVAWYQGRIVHAGTMATGRVYVSYLRRHLILRPGEVYSHDSFTLPAYRGYGLAPARHAHVMRSFHQEGYRRIACLVAVENKAGFRVVEKLGYQAMGLYSCLRVGPWQREWQQRWREEHLPMLARTE